MIRNSNVYTTDRHRQPSADLGANKPFEDFLLFFFFPPDFLGLAGGVSAEADWLLNEIFDRCGGGVGLALCAGGVAFMAGVFCRIGLGDSWGLLDGCGWGVS